MLKEVIKKWAEEGIKLPFCYDPETKSPSVTLLFYWLSGFLAVISLILLHFNKVTYTATGMSYIFVLLGFISYRLRKLDKVKIDLDDQSIELEGKEDNEK